MNRRRNKLAALSTAVLLSVLTACGGTADQTDTRVTMGANGDPVQVCEQDDKAQYVTVKFCRTSGTDKVQVTVTPKAQDGTLDVGASQARELELTEATTFEFDETAGFLVQAAVTEGMGGNAEFEVTWG